MTNLHDVAAAAQLSLATVSRALSGHPKVHPATRRRVEEVARQLGYQSNALARALRQNESKAIGLVIPDLENEFYTSGAAVLQEVFAGEGYRMVLCCSDNDQSTDEELLRSLVERRVDGIAHVPCSPDGSASIRELNPRLPIVEYARRSGQPHVDSITGDEERGAAALIGHLIELGHRRIAMIAGPENLSTTEARVEGFRQAVTLAGLHLDDCPILHGDYDVEFGRTATAAILQEHPEVTAIFASSSRAALGVLRTLRQQNRTIPGDMSVVSFLNPEWFEVSGPPLTTYELPLKEMGAMAAHLLLSRIRATNDDGAVPEPRRVSVEGRLIVRDSTGQPRT
jgi:LacI family transcriptional regulator